MRLLAAPIAVAVLSAACTRDLDLPSQNRVAISPAFATVAPRELQPLVATGGAGGYRFSFSPGGRLSGPDASIDETTGVYVAGGDGSAQDLIRVTDATGSVAEARVTVTSRLAAVPPEVYLSPGATFTPSVGGGRPPYTFTLAPGAGSTANLSGALYTAGPEGDVTDRIAVSDGTADPAAVTTVVVHVGPRVRLYPPTASVAPGEVLPFVSLGGEPPYVFSVSGGSGATISPTGGYVAGAIGSTTDHVTVTDGNLRTATVDVAVGGALALAIGGGQVRPGITSPLLATGGKAPYRFAYAPRGNRSLGVVVEQTGDYVPGQNVGSRDRVMVTDAVGAVAYLDPPPVGPIQIHAGPGASRCIAADLNGDGRGDAVVVTEDLGNAFLAARSLSLPGAGGAVEHEVYLPPGHVHDQVLVADFNGTGRDQLVFFGSGGLWSLVPDAAGGLVFGPSIPASAFSSPVGTGLPAALFPGGTTNRIVTSARCGSNTGLWRVDWPVGASSPNAAPICETVAVAATPFAMTAADVNGDARLDLVWLEAPGANLSNGPLKVALGLAGGGFGATTSYPFQVAGDAYIDPWWWGIPETTLVGTPLGVYVTLMPSSGSQHVVLFRAGTGGASPTWASGFPLTIAAGVGISGLAARDTTGSRMAAWNMTNGTLAYFDVGPSGPTAPVVSTNAHPTLCTTFSDVNGDGLPDLVSGDSTANASDVLFGDGGSRYGERPWFARSGPYAAVGDVDGDGLGDVAVASGDRSIRVLFGGAGQLAYGPETVLTKPVVGLAGGDLGLARPAVVAVDQAGALWRIPFAADGTASAPVQLGVVSLYYSRPSHVGVYDLGGTASGGDVVVVTENGDRNGVIPPGYSGSVFYRNTGGSGYASTDILFGDRWCETLAAVTPGSPPGEIVALCVSSDRASERLYRAVVGQGTYASAWDAISVPSLAGTGANAFVAAAGALPGGQALFVASPGAASGPQKVYAVAVGTGKTVTITQLSGASGPVTGAALGTEGGAGTGWLVVAAGGEVRTYLVSGPGSFTPVATTAAPGIPAAILPLTTSTRNDVLFATPDAFVPLVGNGSGGLQ